jgi:tetratricopeptide (TPR) repeat protein
MLILISCGNTPTDMPVENETPAEPTEPEGKQTSVVEDNEEQASDEGSVEEGEALQYYQDGIAAYMAGDLQKALVDFTKAIEVSPDYAEAYYQRGHVYIETGDLQKALEDFSATIDSNDEYPEAYYARGGMYYALGDYEMAMRDFDTAIILAPDMPQSYFDRGVLFMVLGDVEAAIADFQSYVDMSPDAEDRDLVVELIQDLQTQLEEVEEEGEENNINEPSGENTSE